MTFMLDVSFSGLCGLQAWRGNRARVYLPNATQPSKASGLQPHYPRMRLLTGRDGWGEGVDLLGKLVDIVPSGQDPADARLITDLRADPGAPAPDRRRAYEEADISWLPDIELLVPGFGGLAEDVFGDPPNLEKLAARVELGSGWIQSTALIRDQSFNDVVWVFRDSLEAQTEYARQAIACEFRARSLVRDAAGGSASVAVSIRDWRSGEEQRFELTDEHAIGGRVLIRIENECDCAYELPERIEDFAWFYRLVRDSPKGPIPFQPAGAGVTTATCPGAKFPPGP